MEIPQELSKEQQLILGMFRKFLTDASNMLGNNMSPLAFQVRVKLEEAGFLGGLVIGSTPMPQQQAPQAPESCAVEVDVQQLQQGEVVDAPTHPQ